MKFPHNVSANAQRVRARIREMRDDVNMDVWYEKSNGSKIPTPILKVLSTISYARYTFGSMACFVRGHKFELVASAATPDTGWETFECTRCGHTHEVTYY